MLARGGGARHDRSALTPTRRASGGAESARSPRSDAKVAVSPPTERRPVVDAHAAGVGVIDFVDRSTYKQGLFMPGVHLPIRPTEALLEEQPDLVVLLAWNFQEEIVAQQAEYVRRGGRFVVPIPEVALI
jgi:hypothetical protein